MIDQTGKKIIEEDKPEDISFILAEIKFFIKGFRKESDDVKALNIARNIKKFLQSKGKYSDISDALSEMENYSEQTKSDTFMWELVYIRRFISDTLIKNKENMIDAAEYSLIAAKHFEKICELAPSLHNRCCRVQEYITAALNFSDAGVNSKKISIFTLAKDLFLQIEEGDKLIYWTTGRFLYSNMYIHIDGNIAEDFHALKETVRYSREIYMHEKNYRNLEFFAVFYSEYLSHKRFSFYEEEENLKTLIYLIEEFNPSTSKMKTILEKLKNALIKFQDDTNDLPF